MRLQHERWIQIVGTAVVVLAMSVASAVTAAQQPAAAAPAASVWAGVYTDDQAKRGEAVAGKLCSACHGPALEGGEAGPSLVGLEFLSNWNTLSMADLYDRVHSTMPADAPGTMTPQQTSDVMAYVLKLNKYPAGQAELSTDLAALKTTKIEAQQPAK
jgi:mono/diheme cytochrome c family protein